MTKLINGVKHITLLENNNRFLTSEGFDNIVKSIESQIATNLVFIEKITVTQEAYAFAVCRDYKTGNKYQVEFEATIKGAKYLLTRAM